MRKLLLVLSFLLLTPLPALAQVSSNFWNLSSLHLVPVNSSWTIQVSNQSADPSSPVNGLIYYNTSTNHFRCYENSAWVNCIGTGSGISSLTAGSGINGGTITTSGTISLANYLSTTSIPTNGQLAVWGPGTWPANIFGVSTNTASCSSGVSCTSFSIIGPNAVSITNSGVTSLAASGNVSVSGSTGAVTVTVPWEFTPSTYGVQVSATNTPILDYPGFISATTTFGTINATSSITNAGVKNALVLASATGLQGAYGGASACTANNFVTTISGVGATTCGTASISGVSLGGTLSSLSVSGSITGTSYNGSAAVSDWALNMANANSWTAKQTFVTASSTNLGVSGSLYIPTASNITPTNNNQIQINTTAASSSMAFGANQMFATTSVSFMWSTSTPSTSATDTLPILLGPRGNKFDSIACVSVGGTAIISIGNGTATSTSIKSVTTPRAAPTTLTTNNSFDEFQTLFVAIGTYSANTVSAVTCGLGLEYTY